MKESKPYEVSVVLAKECSIASQSLVVSVLFNVVSFAKVVTNSNNVF